MISCFVRHPKKVELEVERRRDQFERHEHKTRRRTGTNGKSVLVVCLQQKEAQRLMQNHSEGGLGKMENSVRSHVIRRCISS